MLGSHALYHVAVALRCLDDHVPILLPRLEETSAKGTAFALDHATKGDVLVNTVNKLSP